MKHIYLILLLGLGCGSYKPVKAQVHGFENWVTRTEGTTNWEDPQGWFTLNSLGKFGFPATTTSSSDAHSGTRSALLETTQTPFGTIPGILTLGDMLDDNGEADLNRTFVPFQGRPTHIRFWVKAEPDSGDSVAMLCQLRKTIADGSQLLVAEAGWTFGDYSNGWMKVEIPMEYLSNELPDSISILFASSRDESAPVAGSKLWVDDLELEGLQVGQKELNVESFAYYPNPTSKSLTFVGPAIEGVKIFDLMGNLLKEIPVMENTIQLDLAAGHYLIQPNSSKFFYQAKPLIIN
ncbi:MAG: hypothetical protein L6Q78_05625 [Bacteroidia bacterium]|nr:hypothetical protein [Bacteroidia bacterium]